MKRTNEEAVPYEAPPKRRRVKRMNYFNTAHPVFIPNDVNQPQPTTKTAATTTKTTPSPVQTQSNKPTFSFELGMTEKDKKPSASYSKEKEKGEGQREGEWGHETNPYVECIFFASYGPFDQTLTVHIPSNRLSLVIFLPLHQTALLRPLKVSPLELTFSMVEYTLLRHLGLLHMVLIEIPFLGIIPFLLLILVLPEPQELLS